MPDLDESMGTERWPWPPSASLLSLESYWGVVTPGRDSIGRIRIEEHTELLRAQIWSRNRDPQWDQWRHGWQQRSDSEGLRHVCNMADISDHKPSVVLGTIQQGHREPSSCYLSIFLSYIRPTKEK